MTTPVQGRPPTFVSICLAVLLGLSCLSACSATKETVAAPSTPAPARVEDKVPEAVALTSHAVSTRSGYGKIYGRLPVARRKALRRKVTSIVEEWWEAAYLGGDYPRRTFRAAFPRFARGAQARARQDKSLMSNQDIGARIDSVTPLFGQVTLDTLAVRKRARAVTARFTLRFRTTAERGQGARKQEVVVVRGRLFLSRRNGSWQVFGYDVKKWSKR